jgi:hypothetical protein
MNDLQTNKLESIFTIGPKKPTKSKFLPPNPNDPTGEFLQSFLTDVFIIGAKKLFGITVNNIHTITNIQIDFINLYINSFGYETAFELMKNKDTDIIERIDISFQKITSIPYNNMKYILSRKVYKSLSKYECGNVMCDESLLAEPYSEDEILVYEKNYDLEIPTILRNYLLYVSREIIIDKPRIVKLDDMELYQYINREKNHFNDQCIFCLSNDKHTVQSCNFIKIFDI